MITELDKEMMYIVRQSEVQSKCVAKHVACLLVKNGNILSIGINGTIAGTPNCCDRFDSKKEEYTYIDKRINHHDWSLIHEIHAEMNAIKKIDNMNSLHGATAYISYSPCVNCAKMLALFGIKRVVYSNMYDNFRQTKHYLESLGIEVEHCELEC